MGYEGEAGLVNGDEVGGYLEENLQRDGLKVVYVGGDLVRCVSVSVCFASLVVV